MSALISEIVDSAIRYAQERSMSENYDWPTAREALDKILNDLEQRSPADVSIERLRRFIAERERAWASGQGGTGAPH